jgi:segregation and condensation protein A
VAFTDTFAICEDRIHAIFVFLSLLELVQLHILQLRIGEGMNNFWLMKGEFFRTDMGIGEQEAESF